MSDISDLLEGFRRFDPDGAKMIMYLIYGFFLVLLALAIFFIKIFWNQANDRNETLWESHRRRKAEKREQKFEGRIRER